MIGALSVLLAEYSFMEPTSPNTLVYGVVGVAGLIFGIALQRGQFDPVQMFGDLVYQRNGWLARGFMYFFGIGILSVGIITFFTGNMPPTKPSGPLAFVGSFILGFGSALGGASAVSLVHKIGEGRVSAMLQTFAIFVAWVVMVPFVAKPAVSFNKSFGGFGWPWSTPLLTLKGPGEPILGVKLGVLVYGVVASIAFAAISYYLAKNYSPEGGMPQMNEVKKKVADGGRVVKSDAASLSSAFKKAFATPERLWDPRVAGTIAVFANTIFFVSYQIWGADALPGMFRGAGPLGFIASYFVWPVFGFTVPQWFPGEWWWAGTKALPGLAIGTWAYIVAILGAFLAAVWYQDFKIRTPPKGKKLNRYALSILGGFGIALGVRLALACDCAGFLTAISTQANLVGLVYAVGIFPGMYAGFKVKRMLM